MIRTIFIFELVAYALGILLLVTQILVPAIFGRPLFPILRKRGLRAEQDLAEAKDTIEVQELEQQAKNLRSPPVNQTAPGIPKRTRTR